MARRTTSVVCTVISASALGFVLVSGAPASAQVTATAPQVPPTNDVKWELDFHVGGAFVDKPTAGSPIGAFPVGEAFPPSMIRPGRYASTWFFGDGAVLLNQAAAGFVGIPVAARMTPLDPMLTRASVERGHGLNLGVRLSRRLAPRWRAEFSVDSLAGTLKLTDAAVQSIEAARASFSPVWDGIIATGGGVLFANGNTSSTSALVTGTDSRQTSVTGAVNFALSSGTRLTPYLTAGAGVLVHSGDLPTATLTGSYQFRFLGTAPFNESDVVKVHFAMKDRVPVGLFGGGVKYALSPRQGLRLDVRVHLSPNSLDTLVDAHPSSVLGSPAFVIASGTSPSLVFSNTPATRSSLTGPAISDLKTFTGEGYELQTSLTLGYSLRFSAAPAAGGVRTPRAPAAPLTGPKWELDAHAGGGFRNQPTSGTRISAFPAGESFPTSSFRPSRYASSWYFGDGALLINEIAAAFIGTSAAATRLTPLDPVLTAAGVKRQGGGVVGVRLGRRLTPRLSAELEIDSMAGSLKMTDSALEGLEATRASFTPMWNALIATGTGIFLNPSVSSTSTLAPKANSRETSVTGAVTFALRSNGRLTPYATAGAGVLLRSGDLPTATLTGSYQFRFLGTAPFNESDVVKVHFAMKDSVPVGLFGGGVKYALSPRQGLRADLHVHLSPNSIDTLVDASPSAVFGSPAFVIASGTSPSLVFSNTSATRSNLTGPAITDLKTFTGSGLNVRTNVTVGYFVRF
jgi:hypothetical protein